MDGETVCAQINIKTFGPTGIDVKIGDRRICISTQEAEALWRKLGEALGKDAECSKPLDTSSAKG